MQLNNKLLVTLEIQMLANDFWHEVDHNWGKNAAEFFVEDGVYDLGNQRLVGRDAIKSFYNWRQERGARVARHLVNNMRVSMYDGDSTEAISILSLVAADGEPPLPSEPPIMLGDVIDKCVRGTDGRWRDQSRVLRKLFAGKVPGTVPPPDFMNKRK